MGIRTRSRGISSSKEASPGCLIAFFGVFLVMGLIFTGVMVTMFVKRVQTRTWESVPCVVRESSVKEKSGEDGGYRLHVTYAYTWKGREYTCSAVGPDYGGSSDYAEVQRLADAYAVGTKTTCLVNPAHPAEAYLRHGSLWFGLIILFPLVFVAIGAGGIWFGLRSRSRAAKGGEAAEPISGRAKTLRGARWIPAAFCAVFFLVGLGVTLGLFLPALLGFLDAKSWKPTPCTVLSSRVQSHRGDDSTTYSVDILYEYAYGGRTYRSNRYTFMDVSSSGYADKKKLVQQHRKGSKKTCYVNPKDPTEAVLEREFTPVLLFVLIPLAFMLIGGLGLPFAIRSARRKGAEPPGVAWKPPALRPGDGGGTATGLPPDADRLRGGASTGPVTLQAKSTPVGAFFGLLIFALIWNGITSIFVWQAIKAWKEGDPEWFLMIFLIPFVLIGLGVIVGVLYQFLALFNPRPQITASASSLPLGGTLDIAWKIPGRERRIKRLRIRLEGREEVQYRRGTSTVTDRRLFAAVDVTDVRSAYEIRGGRAILKMPADAMHSFESANNKILWTLKVHGEVDKWPDVKLEFPIAVLPS